jgi:hypothetical protein
MGQYGIKWLILGLNGKIIPLPGMVKRKCAWGVTAVAMSIARGEYSFSSGNAYQKTGGGCRGAPWIVLAANIAGVISHTRPFLEKFGLS